MMLDFVPEAVLFDLDNTLVARDRAMRRAVTRWLERRGVEALDRAVDEVMEYDAHGYRERSEFCRWLSNAYPNSTPNPTPTRSPQAIGEELRAELVGFVEPAPSVRALIERLAERFRLGLVSNGGSTTQRAKLSRAGLDGLFEPAVLISGEVGVRKPAPAIFEMALERLGVSADKVLFVGDDLVRDIAGAASVGMRTCRVGDLTPLAPVDVTADIAIERVEALGFLEGDSHARHE